MLLSLLAMLLAACLAFGIYVNDYYHADPSADAALISDEAISVTEQNGNLVFAPKAPSAGLIFYPGGKVEYTAYAPLLHDLAEDGVLNREKYEDDRTNLPTDTTEVVVDGGCHAGFGSYSVQKGDGTPTLSAETQ